MRKLRELWSSLKRWLGWDQLIGGPSGFFLDPQQESNTATAGPEESPAPPAAPPAESAEPLPPPRLQIRVGSPQIAPQVVPLSAEGGVDEAPGFATSFIACWRPLPSPDERWVQFLREAPFGTQAVSARELLWDGQTLSIQRVQEKEIEAFAKMMEEWVDYANREYARWENTPEEVAAYSARERASRLQDRLRK